MRFQLDLLLSRVHYSDFTPLPPSHSSPHHQCDCRLTPSPRSDIYILPSLPPIDPHPSIDIRVVAIEGRGSTPSSTGRTLFTPDEAYQYGKDNKSPTGAISVPPPPPTQAWVTGKPSSSTPQQGFFRKVLKASPLPLFSYCFRNVYWSGIQIPFSLPLLPCRFPTTNWIDAVALAPGKIHSLISIVKRLSFTLFSLFLHFLWHFK